MKKKETKKDRKKQRVSLTRTSLDSRLILGSDHEGSKKRKVGVVEKVSCDCKPACLVHPATRRKHQGTITTLLQSNLWLTLFFVSN